MPRARDFLERLRPVGAPGAAGPAGVPADRSAEVAVELQPVFAALADVEAELRRERDAGREEAAQRRRRASERAAEILAGARGAAQAERAAVATTLRYQADAAAADAQAAAEREAAQIHRRAARRLPALVATVVDRVRADLAGPADRAGTGGAP